ncbi:MAG: hypothetical protein A2Y33_06565 [Spirochaetes bacterium GWF1_51_8]|nr:MAG: hypothetical protein A2Y33_06565 [Spirochaetes bacterium GWF1_51_8]
MALIEKLKGRMDANSGYSRVFGNQQLGSLVSRVHATSISAGNELEKIISSFANTSLLLDDILNENFSDGVYLITKKAVKKSKLKLFSNLEPDLLIFEIKNKRRHCYIVELKDGDNFDTKKSSGEKENMKKFESHISNKIQFTTSIHFCCFNQDSRHLIVNGFKGRISEDDALTGKELCQILKIDYDKILTLRKKDQRENFEYFINNIISIPQVKDYLKDKLV